MNFESPCDRTRRLIGESRDRDLSSRESETLNSHVQGCPECARAQSMSHLALSLLRNSGDQIEEPGRRFQTQLVRRWRSQQVRAGVGFWSPVLLGASIGLGLMLAALQLVQQPLIQTGQPAGEARNLDTRLPLFPDIDSAPRNP